MYVQHDIDLSGHPKLLRLASELQRELELPADFDADPSVIAEGVVSRLWCWALKYADDGDLSSYSDGDIARGAGWRGDAGRLVDALAASGFIDLDGEQRTIHDWEDYAGALVRRRKANARRMRESRRQEAGTSVSSEPAADTCDARAPHVSGQRSVAEQNGAEPEQRSEEPWPAAEAANGRSGCGKQPPSTAVAVDDGFASFWSAYPRREDKKRSHSAWRRLTKAERVLAAGVAQIMTALVAGGHKELRHVPMASTFLNGKRWEDWREGVPAGWQAPGQDVAAAQSANLAAAVAAAKREEGIR